MSQDASVNPWLTMWSQPKNTVRALIRSRPAYGVFYLVVIYALQGFFFYSNWWSLGLTAHFYTLLIMGVVLSPLIGLVWLYYAGFIFHLTGRWLKGRAPASHLRTAIAWSKLPYTINLLMWLVLIFMNPKSVFIQDAAEGPSSIFVNFITMILGIWSLVLLVQSVSEVQQFTVARSAANILIAWFISSIIVFFFFGLFRYIQTM